MTCLLQTYKIILWLLLDFGGRAYFGQEIFYMPVLLVNNAFWKKENMTQKLIDLTPMRHDKVDFRQISILNMLFEHKYGWNWILIKIILSHINSLQIINCLSQDYPAIIHYLSHRKPCGKMAAHKLIVKLWYYHGLEWTELGQNHIIYIHYKYLTSIQKEHLSCLKSTASDHIEQKLRHWFTSSDIQFKIAARVIVSDLDWQI